MAGLRHGQPSCIRVGFQKRQMNVLHRVKAYHKKYHVDFVEGIWREFLDSYGDSETPGCSAYSCPYWSLGDVTCALPLHKLRSRRPVHLEDLLLGARDPMAKAASRDPVSLEATDVDMQPTETGSPKVQASAAQLSGSPEDLKMMDEDREPPLLSLEPPETGRRMQGRARVSRLPPRLGTERDKGPKLRLSKRKLELVLTEPEKSKRKRHRHEPSDILELVSVLGGRRSQCQ